MKSSILQTVCAVFFAAIFATPAVWADSAEHAIENVNTADRDQGQCGGWMICFSYDKEAPKTLPEPAATAPTAQDGTAALRQAAVGPADSSSRD